MLEDFLWFLAFMLGTIAYHLLFHKILLERARKSLLDQFMEMIKNNEEVTMTIVRKDVD